jgi:hypothetical protein
MKQQDSNLTCSSLNQISMSSITNFNNNNNNNNLKKQTKALLKEQENGTDLITGGDYIKAIMIGVFSTLLISILLISTGWFYYAYTNPTSSSGIWLIEVFFLFKVT